MLGACLGSFLNVVIHRVPQGTFFSGGKRSHCPSCLADDWRWEPVSGRGHIHAVTIDRVGHDPALAGQQLGIEPVGIDQIRRPRS